MSQTTEEKLQEMLGDYYQMGSPGSPNAAILQNILGAENELRDPQSENEALLKLIYEDGQLINQEAVEACTEAKEACEAAQQAVESHTAAVYDSTKTYAVGEYVVYDGALYVCTTAVTTAEEWDANKWTETTVGEALTSLQNEVDEAERKIDAISIKDTASGAIASFTDGADGMPVKSCVVQIEPIQEGSGDPSPTNIRPISGHTGADVSACGVNVWDEEWEVGAIDDNTGENAEGTAGIRTKNYIRVEPGKQFYAYIAGQTGTNLKTRWYDKSKNYIGSDPSVAYGNVFTAPANAYYLRFCPQNAYGITYNHDISINHPSTDHDYHAYTGTTKSISFPSTIYGGTDEIVSGSGKKTMEIVDLGSLDWHNNGNDSVYADISGMMTNADIALCSHLKRVSVSTAVADMPNGSFKTYTNAGRIAVKYTGVTAQNAETMLAGMQFVYELATPTDFSTTPVTDLVSLKGDNNVWNTAGDTEVEYVADPAKYIDKKLAALA